MSWLNSNVTTPVLVISAILTLSSSTCSSSSGGLQVPDVHSSTTTPESVSYSSSSKVDSLEFVFSIVPIAITEYSKIASDSAPFESCTNIYT